MMRTSLLATLLLLLAGCGFHLRGAVELPEAMARTQIVAPASSALRYEIESLLLAADGEVVEEAGVASAILTVQRDQVRSRILSVDPQGRAREYALSLSVQYRLQDAEGKELVAQQSSRVERSLRVDPDNVLAQASEREMVEQEMRATAARIIVRRLRSLLQGVEAIPAQ